MEREVCKNYIYLTLTYKTYVEIRLYVHCQFVLIQPPFSERLKNIFNVTTINRFLSLKSVQILSIQIAQKCFEIASTQSMKCKVNISYLTSATETTVSHYRYRI